MGCYGNNQLSLNVPFGSDPAGPNGPTTPLEVNVPVSAVRRLTRVEYDNTLVDLIGSTPNADGTRYPLASSSTPFDNDYTAQVASQKLIEDAEALANVAAAKVAATPSLWGCTPTSDADESCMRRFITDFGRRAFRRSLETTEIDSLVGLYRFARTNSKPFSEGVRLVVSALLQDPRFLYRLELGTPVAGSPGLFRLNPVELASRLSYLLWASTPPLWLLAQAEEGLLNTPEQLREAATKLLTDERAKRQLDRFHAFWLGYQELRQSAELNQAMSAESSALVRRVVFDQPQPYRQLFLSDSTFINPLLATQYGLPAPTSSAGAWVSYGSNPRRGILSHGSFLSVGQRFGDTSPTQRGLWIRTRLLCESIPPPPPDVSVDEPPVSPTSPCKADRYYTHAASGCASCHQLMDRIGFGLENYDIAGKYRATDVNLPECPISGNGEVVGAGAFNGPGGLGAVLADTGKLEACAAKQYFRMAVGRLDRPQDAGLVAKLTAGFHAGGDRFQELILALVTEDTFRMRAED